eukprot:COSAG06_NODE_71_length_25945_cov_9.124468_32_plen_58_part_00
MVREQPSERASQQTSQRTKTLFFLMFAISGRNSLHYYETMLVLLPRKVKDTYILLCG